MLFRSRGFAFGVDAGIWGVLSTNGDRVDPEKPAGLADAPVRERIRVCISGVAGSGAGTGGEVEVHADREEGLGTGWCREFENLEAGGCS